MAERAGSGANAHGMPSWPPSDFLKFGKERTSALLAIQKELLDTYEQASQAWLSRMKSEATLWSELAARLTEIHSLPEALSAYRQTILQRMQMASDDGHRLSDEAQRVIRTITTSLTNGSRQPAPESPQATPRNGF